MSPELHRELCVFVDLVHDEFPLSAEHDDGDLEVHARRQQRIAERYPLSSEEYAVCLEVSRDRAKRERKRRPSDKRVVSSSIDTLTRSCPILDQNLMPVRNPNFRPRWYPIHDSQRFRLGFDPVKCLGGGSTSKVWQVNTTYGGYELVVKYLRGDTEFSEKQRQALALLVLRISKNYHHPNVAQVYDVGELEGVEDKPVPFISMEYIEGVTLEEWRTNNKPSPPEAVRTVIILARVLQDLHSKVNEADEKNPIYHFDLKPSNVMVANIKLKKDSSADVEGQSEASTPTTTDSTADSMPSPTLVESPLNASSWPITKERLKLIDLGSPSIMTFRYAAPERYRNNPTPGVSWDIFPLGGILYFLLTGKHPLSTKGVTALDWEQWLQSLDLGDADLTDICRKCLAWDADERFTTSEKFAESLEAWVKDEPIPHLGRIYSWWAKEKLLWKRSRNHNEVADHLQILGRMAVILAFALIAMGTGHVVRVLAGMEPMDAAYGVIQATNVFAVVMFLVGGAAVRFQFASLKILEPLAALVVSYVCIQHFVEPQQWCSFPNWEEFSQSGLPNCLQLGLVAICFGSLSPEWKVIRPIGWTILLSTFFLRPIFDSPWNSIAMPVTLAVFQTICCLSFAWTLLQTRKVRGNP